MTEITKGLNEGNKIYIRRESTNGSSESTSRSFEDVTNNRPAPMGPPGPRGEAPMSFYLAYLEDPAGNKICSMHNM